MYVCMCFHLFFLYLPGVFCLQHKIKIDSICFLNTHSRSHCAWFISPKIFVTVYLNVLTCFASENNFLFWLTFRISLTFRSSNHLVPFWCATTISINARWIKSSSAPLIFIVEYLDSGCRSKMGCKQHMLSLDGIIQSRSVQDTMRTLLDCLQIFTVAALGSL